MAVVKTHGKGQVIVPKDIRDKLGIVPGRDLSVELVGDHIEIRPLPEDPIEYLTGIFENHNSSLADELLKERKVDDAIDESDRI